MINKEIKIIFQEIENNMETEEYIEEHKEIEKQCNTIKLMPLDNLKNIQAAKEASRKIPMSPEKVLLFKYLITIEKQLINR